MWAVALAGAAAAAQERVPFTVVNPADRSRVAQPQARVEMRKDAALVTIHAGEKPTGGYSVRVQRVERAKPKERCTVFWQLQSPPRDAMVTQALTYPSVTIRLPASCSDIRLDPELKPAAAR